LLAGPEKRALTYLAEKMPAWVTSDQLTLLGLSAMLLNIFDAKLSCADAEGLEKAEKIGLQAKELAYRLIIFAKGEAEKRRGSMISDLLKGRVIRPISSQELERRWKAVRERMAEKKHEHTCAKCGKKN
jgi:hypothetical protein